MQCQERWNIRILVIGIQQISRKCWWIVRNCRVLFKTEVHLVPDYEVKHGRVTGHTVPGPVVRVQGNSGLFVQHDHHKRVLLFLAENVGVKHVGSVDSANKLWGMSVKWFTVVEKNLVEFDVCVLKNGPKPGGSCDEKCDPRRL